MVLISVIIPTIRPGGLLEFQLPSLAEQKMARDDYEIVVVDDYPKSRESAVRKFSGRENLIVKWMRSKQSFWRSNENVSNARNTGLHYADGELIVFIDDYSWVRPEFLSSHWMIYSRFKPYTLIGPVMAVEYRENPPRDLSTLPIVSDDARWVGAMERDTVWDCPAGWFFTSNASAPLDKIIEVNGFWEMADLTREEDVMLGLTLERIGGKFCFIKSLETTVYHMQHGAVRMDEVPRKYKQVTYEDLGWETVDVEGRMVQGGGGKGVCGLNTKPDEIQLVTRDVFNTRYPGSWGLIEHLMRTPNLRVNEEIGFDLTKERRKRGERKIGEGKS